MVENEVVAVQHRVLCRCYKICTIEQTPGDGRNEAARGGFIWLACPAGPAPLPATRGISYARRCGVFAAMSSAHAELSPAKPGLIAHWDSDVRRREQMTAWLLVAPAVLAIILLFIIPIGY